MDVHEAIYGRQSQGKLKQDPVPKELIEKLLDAGVQAPNHYKVRPWRFVVLTGNARVRLGQVMAVSQAGLSPDVPKESLEQTQGLTLRKPVLNLVGVDNPTE